MGSEGERERDDLADGRGGRGRSEGSSERLSLDAAEPSRTGAGAPPAQRPYRPPGRGEARRTAESDGPIVEREIERNRGLQGTSEECVGRFVVLVGAAKRKEGGEEENTQIQ